MIKIPTVIANSKVANSQIGNIPILNLSYLKFTAENAEFTEKIRG